MSNRYASFHKHVELFSEGLICTLRHGIEFGIWNPSGKLSMRNVDSFLEDAMTYYGELRGSVKPYRFAIQLLDGNCDECFGMLQLCPPKRLRAALWVEAIAEVQSAAKSVQQLSGAQNEVEPTEGNDGGIPGLKDIVKKPGGELMAIFVLIRRGQDLTK